MTTTDQERKIANRDYVLIVDKSGSMREPGFMGNSRWDEAGESTACIAAEVEPYDPDGLTLYLFASNYSKHEVKAAAVSDVFKNNSPFGGTNLADPLDDAINGQDGFFARKAQGLMSDKDGMTIIVVTDGEPPEDNKKKVMRLIIDATKKLDNGDELSIAFFQVGNDPMAKDFLSTLDDNLQSMGGAAHDIVDTKTFEELEQIGLRQALLDALYD